MNIVDIVIVSIIINISAIIIYFNFIKNKENRCTKCPYRKDICNSIKKNCGNL